MSSVVIILTRGRVESERLTRALVDFAARGERTPLQRCRVASPLALGTLYST